MPGTIPDPIIIDETEAFADAKAAYDQVMTWLGQVEPGDVRPPLVTKRRAAIAAVALSKLCADPTIAAGLAKVPEALFDPVCLTRLKPLALTLWHMTTEAETAAVQETQVRVPVALVNQALALRTKLLSLVEYYLGDVAAVAAEVVSIRSGTGYFDTASDLTRLARLVEDNRVVLQEDRKHYDAGDSALALRLAKQIIDELGSSGEAKDWEARQAKVWALLYAYYTDIYDTGRYVFRNKPTAERFESLAQASRGPARKATGDAPEQPVVPPA